MKFVLKFFSVSLVSMLCVSLGHFGNAYATDPKDDDLFLVSPWFRDLSEEDLRNTPIPQDLPPRPSTPVPWEHNGQSNSSSNSQSE